MICRCGHAHPEGSKCLHDTVFMDDAGRVVDTYRCPCDGAQPPKHDAEYTDGPTGAAANGWDLPWDESEDDDGEPDAYEVWNATGEFPK